MIVGLYQIFYIISRDKFPNQYPNLSVLVLLLNLTCYFHISYGCQVSYLMTKNLGFYLSPLDAILLVYVLFGEGHK